MDLKKSALSIKSDPNPQIKFRDQVIAFFIIWLASISAFLFAVRVQLLNYSGRRSVLVPIIIAFAFQLALYWIPGFPAIRKRIEGHLNRSERAILLGGLLIAPYIIYRAGSGTFNIVSFLKLIVIAAIPLCVYALIPPHSQKLCWQDLIVLLVIALPAYSGWYHDIWSVPTYLDAMARLFVVSSAGFAILSMRGLEGTGYVWQLHPQDWVEAAKQLVFFSVIGIPLGFFLRFIAWHPLDGGILQAAFSFIAIFIFIAVLEELFFRGVLQNLLEKTLANKYAARGIASALFGLSHIYHGFPNWRYVIMAAIAGWFYGTAWHNRRSVVAASLVHAAVDTLWRQFFRV